MTTQEEIIAYLKSVSAGKISITKHEATVIMQMSMDYQTKVGVAIVKVSRYNAQIRIYEPLRTIFTTDEIVKSKVLEYLDKPQDKEFYQYECKNSFGEYEGMIWTCNSSVFD